MNDSAPPIENEADPVASHHELARPADVLPSVLPVLPLPNRPFFPAQVMPLVVDREPWQKVLEAVSESSHKVLGLILIRSDSPVDATPEDFHEMGTVCRVHRIHQEGDKLQVFVEGLQRFRVMEWLSGRVPHRVRARYYPEMDDRRTEELRGYAVAVINTIKELLPLNPLYGEELKLFLNRFGPDQPSHLADFAAALTTAGKDELQDVLATAPILQRLEKVLVLLHKEVEVASAQMRIRKQVEEKVTARQREFFLREQLRAIQQELGIAKDDRTAERDRFTERVEALDLPKEAADRIREEMEKFSVLELGSPEYALTRNYLDWLTLLPWGRHIEDNLNLAHARTVLDRDHDGLEDVKKRIIEFLAVGNLKGEVSGSILLFTGPPGVGKTSLGRSIAEALGRPFYRLSVGGMRDEAEIKGHRRTYIGAMPGKFIQAMKSTGVANPVLMLDEIDKIGVSYRGDPASALLEVLDPEQNREFLDHYLDVRFDLSRVLFLCTSNQLDAIPQPLLDRMEVIRLGGYITSEKLAIARNHLVPRQLEKAGLRRGQLRVSDAALRTVIEQYAREAGVRGLEKRIAAIARKAAVRVLDGESGSIRVGVGDLRALLGRPVHTPDDRLSGVGVVTGLAWTALGGETLSVEAALVHGESRGLRLTGQLGDVMRESAEIAYSHVVAHAADYGFDREYFDHRQVHLHVPAGATPKDGPSAGITMATALVSLGRGRRLQRRLGMTGELTLSGRVLPVGGIREKVIAARRAGIRELILPEGNRGDIEDLPEHIASGLTVRFVTRFPEVVTLAFGKR